MNSVVPLVSFVVLLAAAAPVARIVVDHQFGRVFPRERLLIGAALLAWVATVSVVASMWPAALAPAAIGVAGGVALATWRARPAHGRRRQAPPGSLSLTRSVRGLAHRDALLLLAERHGPIFKSTQFSGTVVCIHGLSLGQRLVREHRAAIGPSQLAFSDQIMGGFLRYMDDNTHDIYGPLFRRAMSRAVTDAAEPVARSATRQMLAGLSTDPISPDEEVNRIAYEAVLAALFAIDPTSSLGVDFTNTYQRFAAGAISRPKHPTTRASLDELRVLVNRHLHDIDQSGSGGAVCALTEIRATDPQMPDAAAIDNLLFMLRIGSNNVASLVRWVLEMLGSQPTWRARIAEEQSSKLRGNEHTVEPDLADAFVMEVLRLAQSEYVYRRLIDDVEFEGFVLRAGWLVRICVWESHRDPTVYDAPATMTDRFHGARRPQSEYCPFGFDRHACNSVGLAMMIARTVLTEFAANPDAVVHPAGDVARELRHWSHWQPGRRLAVSRTDRSNSTELPPREVSIQEHLESGHIVSDNIAKPLS